MCCNAATTNSTWYVQRWRAAFDAPSLPFVYVELCREFGGYEPRMKDFWLAQRSVLSLPATGFVTTTDIERNLHPPDKQDVARRLVLELRRVAYGESITARGPELLSMARDAANNVVMRFSNQTLATHAGIYVGVAQCRAAAGTAADTVVSVAKKNSTNGWSPAHSVGYQLGHNNGTFPVQFFSRVYI